MYRDSKYTTETVFACKMICMTRVTTLGWVVNFIFSKVAERSVFLWRYFEKKIGDNWSDYTDMSSLKNNV